MDNSTIPEDNTVPLPPVKHHASPVVAFIIGLAIILLASILNAAGLNLTKLDHVRRWDIAEAKNILRCFSGPHQSNTESVTEEGLVATPMASWDDSIYVC